MDAVEDRAGGNHKVLAKKIASSPLGKFQFTVIPQTKDAILEYPDVIAQYSHTLN